MITYNYEHKNQDILVYKQMLKELTDINTRRSSKFNLLAIYGALKCLENVKYSYNLSVYIVTKYASVRSVAKVLESQKKGKKVTPFDFLNINGNNAGFYVAKALNAHGKNLVLTTQNNTLEDAVELAKFDMQIGTIEDALVGLVDESIDGILNNTSKDISHWIYLPR